MSGAGTAWGGRGSSGRHSPSSSATRPRFGLNAAFYGLRGKADQWVAATLFSLASFAAFSIAAVVGQLVHILRQSVMESFLPNMSRLQAAGNVRGMLEMNSRGNVMVGKLLYPGLAFVFVFAPELVTMVYTASYSEAAPVMRVYILGMVASVVEMGSLVMLLRQGTYAVRPAGSRNGDPASRVARTLCGGEVLYRSRAAGHGREPCDATRGRLWFGARTASGSYSIRRSRSTNMRTTSSPACRTSSPLIAG